eukprot:403369990
MLKDSLSSSNDKMAPIYTKGSIVDAINIILTAYGFVMNFYPTFSQLDKKTNTNGYAASIIALLFSFIVYMLFSILASEIYGENIQPTLFDNLQYETNVASYFIRVIFLAIFICNMPFAFLPGKECLLSMIEEYRNNTISKQIAHSIKIKQQQDSNYQELKDEEEEKEQVQYKNGAQIAKEMPNKIYFSVTIILFTFQMVCAMLVDDITIVFGFFAAISESATTFFLPAIFYLVSTKIVKKEFDLFSVIGSIIFFILGTALFFFANYHSINKLRNQYA